MVQIQMIPYQFELLPQSAHNRLSMAFRASGKWCHVHDCITNSSLTDVRSPPELRPIHPILVVSRAVHIFLVTHGPRPDVWLVSQLHASRFDIESAIVGYSVIIGRMCVWKRGGCPARGTHCLSSFRPIGDVSKLNTLSQYMGVSKNNGTPKSSILIGFSIINHPFWGTPIFGNPHMICIDDIFCAPTGRLAEEVAVLQQLNECIEQNANEEVPIELLHPNANGCICAGV